MQLSYFVSSVLDLQLFYYLHISLMSVRLEIDRTGSIHFFFFNFEALDEIDYSLISLGLADLQLFYYCKLFKNVI